MHEDVQILLNKTLTSVEQRGNEEILFVTESGESYLMYHEQDCCENVWLEDVTGELDDLVGSPILMAEEVTQDGSDDNDCLESRTWTFYKFATNKGYVTLRWCGESNGYYSESVYLKKLEENE